MTFKTTKLLAAASAVALLSASPSFAADDTNRAQPSQMTPGAKFKADELIGKDIKNVSGESIGNIESVVIDESGKISAVIVGVGGFLGLGDHEVALDWSDLRIHQDGETIETNMTKNDLKAQPAYEYSDPADRQTAFVDPKFQQDRPVPLAPSSGDARWVAASDLRVSKLIGADVVNGENDTIGEVEDLVLQSGQPQLILSVGEFLGMGGHNVSLGLDQAEIRHQEDNLDDLQVTVSMTKDQLKALPEYEADRWKAEK